MTQSKDNGSKIINVLNIAVYFVFYFKQDIATSNSIKKSNKMFYYLRIVADLFYERYEQGKFDDKLGKAMVILLLFRRKSIVLRDKRENTLVLNMRGGDKLIEQKNRKIG